MLRSGSKYFFIGNLYCEKCGKVMQEVIVEMKTVHTNINFEHFCSKLFFIVIDPKLYLLLN